MWLSFVGIAAYIPGVLLTGLCQLQAMLVFVFLLITVVPSKFSLWPEGEEQRGGHRAVRSGMLKFPLAAGQEWCQSFLSIILSCRPSLLNVSGPSISLLLWFWEWKIGYYSPSKLVWLSVPDILLKAENPVLIKRQPAVSILWLTLISMLFQLVSLKL